MEGQKEILGTWISGNESASFYASICADLKNRGVSDIFIACHDNLTGLCDAITSIFPKTKNQLCIVHQIRNSCKFVPYKDRKAVCADLKKIYGAVNLDNAEYLAVKHIYTVHFSELIRDHLVNPCAESRKDFVRLFAVIL